MLFPRSLQIQISEKQSTYLSILANNHNFIKHERQTFAATISALIIGTITILIGVSVIILPLGITSALSISLGMMGIVIGTGVIAYCLKTIYSQCAHWRRNYLEIRQAFNSGNLSPQEEKTDGSSLPSILTSPLEILTQDKTNVLGKTRSVVAILEIISGISCIIGSVISELLITCWFRSGISLSLASIGAALFVAGLANIRAYSLTAQGVSHLYLSHYVEITRRKQTELAAKQVSSLTSRANLLERNFETKNSDYENCKTRCAALQIENSVLRNNLQTIQEQLALLQAPLQPEASTWTSLITSSVSSTTGYLGSFFKSSGVSAQTSGSSSNILALTYPEALPEEGGPLGENSSSTPEELASESIEDDSNDVWEDALGTTSEEGNNN
ncbi:CPSIT_0556 family inclusion membrane protein [Chlamydia vaughanii]|uniref:CPSIT_0556 family inclusion membrane protein n=1 Tax=Chlamydia vaughanii TaxID=3112552 RepID=UPI0032B1C69F